MQTVLSRIWTRIVKFIFKDSNDYTTYASFRNMYTTSQTYLVPLKNSKSVIFNETN